MSKGGQTPSGSTGTVSAVLVQEHRSIQILVDAVVFMLVGNISHSPKVPEGFCGFLLKVPVMLLMVWMNTRFLCVLASGGPTSFWFLGGHPVVLKVEAASCHFSAGLDKCLVSVRF